MELRTTADGKRMPLVSRDRRNLHEYIVPGIVLKVVWSLDYQVGYLTEVEPSFNYIVYYMLYYIIYRICYIMNNLNILHLQPFINYIIYVIL